MKMRLFRMMILMLPVACMSYSHASDSAPWGRASLEKIDYAPHKVVYNVAVSSVESMSHVLDVVSYLSNVYHADPFDASIVMVLHGDEIPFFAVKNSAKYHDLMQRAQSLTVGGIIEFRMCKVAAKGHGFVPEDINGFVKVVPMADAEIVRLQQEEGYAYMR